MLFLYNLSIQLFYLVARPAGFFNKKARKWLQGQKAAQKYIKEISYPNHDSAGTEPVKTIWFHFASLGEFEQGLPVLEQWKKGYPRHQIVITFFSPSGYEIRKDYPLADHVLYLPVDTAANARLFLDTFRPSLIVFTKYEFWYHYFAEASERQIPVFVISAIFRPGQVFFKWYGVFFRTVLAKVSWFFLQNEPSGRLLDSIGFPNHSVSGDTRFDRVAELARSPRKFPEVAGFVKDAPVFIAGSTWPKDEELLARYFDGHGHDWKLIIAPHEVHAGHIANIKNLFKDKCLLYSEIASAPASGRRQLSGQVLIIDQIGLLSALYRYGQIAWIGGGFGTGIHNTLEAAVYGLPVIFGPDYQKFNEAVEMVRTGCAFPVHDYTETSRTLDLLLQEPDKREAAGQLAKEFVQTHTGATEQILEKLQDYLR